MLFNKARCINVFKKREGLLTESTNKVYIVYLILTSGIAIPDEIF